MIAIKLYGQNEKGIPTEWPKECLENVDSLPSGYDFMVPTSKEYNDYLNQHQTKYDSWEKSRQKEDLADISDLQFRLALHEAGHNLVTISSGLSGANLIRWDKLQTFQRSSELVETIGSLLEITPEEMDSLFTIAITF